MAKTPKFTFNYFLLSLASNKRTDKKAQYNTIIHNIIILSETCVCVCTLTFFYADNGSKT